MKFQRQGTKRNLIETLLLQGKSKIEIFSMLRPMVIEQLEPMIFKANDPETHRRVAKPIGEQVLELRFEINRVAKAVRIDDSSFDSLDDDAFLSDEIPTEEVIQEEQEEEESETAEEEEIQEEEEQVKPVKSIKAKAESELRYFLKRVREIRQFCENRAKLSESIDSISMRPAQAAAKLIPAGIPADALLHAMCMHWSEDTRQDAGVAEFDFIALSQRIIRERGISHIAGEAVHKLFGYCLILAENRIPLMLVGPAGTGKSHLARQLASYLEIPYGETPMSPGATRGDLLGRHTLAGFIVSQFASVYSNGGVFNFEEIDASDPSMLIVLNNALASQTLYNSADGEMYQRSPNFVPVATANTFGLGANREYTARERLDAATIDRWRMGRVFVSLDESVEESILNLA